MEPPPVVVLVHGAWHGPWAWASVAGLLSGEGIRSIAVDLPSKGADTAVLGDLHDDAEVVRGAVEAAGTSALVVAHSYGGLPVSEGLAETPNAAHLIYLAAFMLAPGESLLGLRGGVEPEWWLTSEDGRSLFPADPVGIFYSDCPPVVARSAAAALVPQRKDSFCQELRAAAWQRVPSTYVVCGRDNAVPPAAQARMSARAGTVSHIDSGHSPFLSRPAEVTAIIKETLATVVAEAG
jgi:pimeloyl-ACP methyl ester carboxylesterase